MGKVPEKTIIEKYGSLEAYQEYLHKKLSGKHFYTNGIEDKKFADDEDIPEGWYKGRTNCGKGTGGYIWINNGKEQKLVNPNIPIPEGYVIGGLPYTEEHKQNLSKSLKGKKRTEEQCKRISESHKTEEYKKKINATRKEKYGVENFFQDKNILAKAQENAHSEEANTKRQQTCQSHFGVDYPMQSNEIKEKSKQTCFEKYGCEYSFQSDKVKEKSKQTCLEKYGVEYVSQAEEIKEKIRQTNIKKYGVDNPLKSKDVRQQIVNTNIAIRGVAYPTQDCAVLDKQIKTNLERYNVTYNIQLPQSNKGSRDSKPNQQFMNLLEANNIKYEREFALGKYLYDFKVGNTLIEINPSATHNTLWGPYGNHEGIDKNYHKNKSEFAKDYRVIHVFDWDDPQIIVNLLKNNEVIYGRNTIVRDVTKEETDEFLKKNHVQGTCRGQQIRIGLYNNDKLVSIMTFGKPRYNKKYEYELLRYCTINNVIGGAKKLFSHFIKEYNPESVVSYCDKSKFSGKVYTDLGFNLKLDGKPMKHWYNPKEKVSHITDNLLRQRGFDQLFNTNFGKGTSNEQLIIDRGYVSIYDCGQNTYVWLKTDINDD